MTHHALAHAVMKHFTDDGVHFFFLQKTLNISSSKRTRLHPNLVDPNDVGHDVLFNTDLVNLILLNFSIIQLFILAKINKFFDIII